MLVEVALCEDCYGWSHWTIPGSHPWQQESAEGTSKRKCTFCGSSRVSRCETEDDRQKNAADKILARQEIATGRKA